MTFQPEQMLSHSGYSGNLLIWRSRIGILLRACKAFFLLSPFMSIYLSLSIASLNRSFKEVQLYFLCTEIKFPSLAAWRTLFNQAPNAALTSNPFAFKRRRRPSEMSQDRWNVDISVGNESRCRGTKKHIAGRQMSVTAKPHILQMYYRNFSSKKIIVCVQLHQTYQLELNALEKILAIYARKSSYWKLAQT